MKTKYMVIGTFLIMILSVSCFSPWRGDEGNLTIVWGDSSSPRYNGTFVDPEELSAPSSFYEISLTGPGDAIHEVVDYSTASSKTFSVVPGLWTITIKGFFFNFQGLDHELRVMGIEQVEVRPGKNSPKKIKMYTANVVYSWSDLNGLIITNDGNYDPEYNAREELIILEYDEYGHFDLYNDGEPIYITRPVIIIAENDITITRTSDESAPIFYVTDGGILTLGLPGMAGTLTFDSLGNESVSQIVVNSSWDTDNSVYIPSKLVMNKGVTIKNGDLYFNCNGVYVDVESIFIMNGGAITGNHARSGGMGDYGVTGGGVFISHGATFIHNGGAVTGNTPNNIYIWKEEDY